MKKNIIRHDYITKSLIQIIIKEKLNENLRWLKFEEFIKMQKYVISEHKEYLEEEINKLINKLNNINLNNKEAIENNGEDNKNSLDTEDTSNDDSGNNKINSEIEDGIKYNEEVVNNLNIIKEDNDILKDISFDNEDDKNIYLFICNSEYYNNCNEEEISDNYYKLQFKERLKLRKLEEDKKNKPKPFKRRFIYPPDIDSEFSEKSLISDNDIPKKKVKNFS